MARNSNIIIKNIKVDPDRIPNDGTGSVNVEAVVLTVSDGARIDWVNMEVPFLRDDNVLSMEFDGSMGMAPTKEGKYSCSFNVPLLADPGAYRLPIGAEDSTGAVGKGHAPLRIDYKRPPYSGISTKSANRALVDMIGNSTLTRGNHVEVLAEGEDAFDKRMKIVEAAEKQINLQTYSLYAEGMCAQLVEAIMEKARDGVEVNIILNMSSQLAVSPMTSLKLGLQRVGNNIDTLVRNIERQQADNHGAIGDMLKYIPDLIQGMGFKNATFNVIFADDVTLLGMDRKGVGRGHRSAKWLEKMARDRKQLDADRQSWFGDFFQSFRGPGGLPSLPGLSYAVHEKIMVVDGKKAIVGGRNLEDRYFTHWIDKDIYIEGPLVNSIQRGFLRSWDDFAHNQKRDLPAGRMPEDTEPVGNYDARFVQSRPWLGEYYALEYLVTAFQMAKKRILISSQFIVLPDSLLRDAILDAARRGVEVHILTNSHANMREIGVAAGYLISLTYFDNFIDEGVRIYEVAASEEDHGPKPYMHVKEFLIDGKIASIGSFNLSIRSSFIESENLVTIYDAQFVEEQEKTFWNTVDKAAVEVTKKHIKEQKRKFGGKMAVARYLELLY